MSAIQSGQQVQPRAMWLRAWAISLVLAVAFTAMAHWITLIIAPGLLLVCAVLFLPVVYGGTAQRFLLRLPIALAGGVIGTLAMWGLWYGLEFSWAALVDAMKLSPQQMLDRITALSGQITYSVETDVGVTDHGPGFTRALWGVQTAVFALGPVVGAFMGPRGISAVRRRAAEYEAKRAAR